MSDDIAQPQADRGAPLRAVGRRAATAEQRGEAGRPTRPMANAGTMPSGMKPKPFIAIQGLRDIRSIEIRRYLAAIPSDASMIFTSSPTGPTIPFMPKSLRLIVKTPRSRRSPRPACPCPCRSCSTLTVTGLVTPWSVRSPVTSYVALPDLGDRLALEGDRRELHGVEEVGALEVLVALGVAGVDAVGLDREVERRLRRVGLVEGERARDRVEPALGVAGVHVLDAEHHRRVDRVDLVGRGERGGGEARGDHGGEDRGARTSSAEAP